LALLPNEGQHFQSGALWQLVIGERVIDAPIGAG
jgi:hypothetical protein